MDEEIGPKPDFIVIGPGRTGTSWMYEMLLQHPEVCLARDSKETLFFNRYYEQGMEWYSRFFRDCEQSSAIGEITTTYFHQVGVAERIATHLPHVKLIACLREPMERMISAYYYRRRAGETLLSFEEALGKEPDLLEESLYDRCIERYLEHFPEGRIHVLFYEDLKEDPRNFLRDLFSAIGVDPGFEPEGMEQQVNQRSEERIPGLGRLLGTGSRFLRKVGAYRTLDRIKRNPAIKGVFLKEKEPSEAPELSASTQKELNDRFKKVREWVEDFTGRKLTAWENTPYD